MVIAGHTNSTVAFRLGRNGPRTRHSTWQGQPPLHGHCPTTTQGEASREEVSWLCKRHDSDHFNGGGASAASGVKDSTHQQQNGGHVPGRRSEEARRIDWDGKPYALEEVIEWYSSEMSEYDIRRHWESLETARCPVSEDLVPDDPGFLKEKTSKDDNNDDKGNVVTPIEENRNDHKPCSESLDDLGDDASSGMSYSSEEESDATKGVSDEEDESQKEIQIDNTCGRCIVCNINEAASERRKRLLSAKEEELSSIANAHAQVKERFHPNNIVTGYGVATETCRMQCTEQTEKEVLPCRNSIIPKARTPTLRKLTTVLEKVAVGESCTKFAPVLDVTNQDEFYKGNHALTIEGFKFWNKRKRTDVEDLGRRLQYRLFRDPNLLGRVVAHGIELHLRKKDSRMFVVAKREKRNHQESKDDGFHKDPYLEEDNDDGVKMKELGRSSFEEVDLWPLSSLEINWLYGVPLGHLKSFRPGTTKIYQNDSRAVQEPRVDIHPLHCETTMKDSDYDSPSSEILVHQKSLIHYKPKSRWKCIAGDYFSFTKGKLASIALLRLESEASTPLAYLTPYNAIPSVALLKRIRRGWRAWREAPPPHPQVRIQLEGESKAVSIGEEGKKPSGLSNFDWKSSCASGVIVCRYCSTELNGAQQMLDHRFFKMKTLDWSDQDNTTGTLNGCRR